MTGIEALQAMDNGKKVRNTLWAEDKYIYWDGETGHIYSENGVWCKSVDAFVAAFMGGRVEWEIYNNERTVTISEVEGKVIKISGRYHYVPPFTSKLTYSDGTYEQCYILVPMELTANDSGKFITLNGNWTGKVEVKNISAFK